MPLDISEEITVAWDFLEELQDLFVDEAGLGLVLDVHIIDRLAPFEEALGIVRVFLHKCLGLFILIGLVIVLAPVEMESCHDVIEWIANDMDRPGNQLLGIADLHNPFRLALVANVLRRRVAILLQRFHPVALQALLVEGMLRLHILVRCAMRTPPTAVRLGQGVSRRKAVLVRILEGRAVGHASIERYVPTLGIQVAFVTVIGGGCHVGCPLRQSECETRAAVGKTHEPRHLGLLKIISRLRRFICNRKPLIRTEVLGLGRGNNTRSRMLWLLLWDARWRRLLNNSTLITAVLIVAHAGDWLRRCRRFGLAATRPDAPAIATTALRLCLVFGMRMSHNPANRGEENDGSNKHLAAVSGPPPSRFGPW
mmetsp:Transcript_32566/g.95992  ORF Transcript_32566/g.95992 Transcript_32566/m.95992 type:complete len:368 (-) Transcript_32566:307-1410(-)